MVNAGEKFQHYLWHQSKGLQILALFCDDFSVSHKKKIQRAMLKFEGKQEMPFCYNLNTKNFYDFTANDRCALFPSPKIDSSVLKLPGKKLNALESCRPEKLVSYLP